MSSPVTLLRCGRVLDRGAMTPQAGPRTRQPLAELHAAIAKAASGGATYPWIAGVLAACLADETTTSEARAVAVATLSRPPIKPARRAAA